MVTRGCTDHNLKISAIFCGNCGCYLIGSRVAVAHRVVNVSLGIAGSLLFSIRVANRSIVKTRQIW